MGLLLRLDASVLRDSVVVVGFPGPGLIGGIAVEELVESLRLRPVGSLGGTMLPPQALVEHGEAHWPVLFFARRGLVVVKAEADLDGEEAHVFAQAFVRMLRESGARLVVLADGLAGLDGILPPNAVAAWTDAALGRRILESGTPALEEGVLGGATGATLLWAAEEGLPAAAVAAPARPHLPDARAAAAVVDALDRLLRLGVDGTWLAEKGEELERAWSGLLEQEGAEHPGDAMYT